MSDIMSMKSATKHLNHLTYVDYYNRLSLIAKSVFKWEGLPKGINERWIEKWLFEYGQCLFFEDRTKGIMVAKCNPSSMLNHYDEPIAFTPYGTNVRFETMKNAEFSKDGKAIQIKNNDACIPTNRTTNLYALRLAQITRTIDVNIHQQKMSNIITSSEKQRLTFKNVVAQWDEFEPFIFGDKDIDLAGIKVLKTDAPIVFDKLQQQKHQIWNEYMTFLGINNANMDKRERLVDDEVQANNEQIEASANVMLKARENACNEINRVFGTNIKVELRKLNKAEIDALEV